MPEKLNAWGRAPALAIGPLYPSGYSEASCLCCSERPAALDSDFCDPCYNAIAAPDPLCEMCGEPLGEADVEAGEVTCLECAPRRGRCGDARPPKNQRRTGAI